MKLLMPLLAVGCLCATSAEAVTFSGVTDADGIASFDLSYAPTSGRYLLSWNLSAPAIVRLDAQTRVTWEQFTHDMQDTGFGNDLMPRFDTFGTSAPSSHGQLAFAIPRGYRTLTTHNVLPGSGGFYDVVTFTPESYTLSFGLGPDPIQYTVSVDYLGPVPEPATWALMLAGFGLAGSALRRRRVSGDPHRV